MLVSTTHVLCGYEIQEVLGLVCAETVLSGSVFHDWLAGIVNFLGGRARGYEKEMRKARADVLEKLMAQARGLGASAVLGVRIDYEFLPVGTRGGMLMVSAQGTAVRLIRSVGATHPAEGPFQTGE